MQATLAVALCPDAICSGSIQQTHVRSQINARSAMITSSRLLPHIVPPVPIGVQLRPCFGATAESLPALARSSEGWERSSLPRCFFFPLLFAGAAKSRFALSRAFLLRVFAGVSKGALCSLPRPLAARPTANAKFSRQSSSDGHRQAPKEWTLSSERCTQKRLLLPQRAGCVPIIGLFSDLHAEGLSLS